MKISQTQLESIIQEEIEGLLSEKCWPGYEKKGMKKMFGKMYPNCVKKSKKKKRRKKRKNENNNIAITEQELENIIFNEIESAIDEKKKRKKKKSAKTDYSKEKKSGLHGWFSRAGGKGSKGWVDCNTCRKDKKTGKKKCKACGRQKGEKRAKYPACRPTPASCGTKGKGKKWGKKSKTKK